MFLGRIQESQKVDRLGRFRVRGADEEFTKSIAPSRKSPQGGKRSEHLRSALLGKPFPARAKPF